MVKGDSKLKVLALDTSSISASVAVMDGNVLLGEYFLNHKKTHSQKLAPMIQKILTSLELKLDDIDLFAVVKGPGSFTGLRIGVVTAKALAYSLKKPVIGIPTLDVLAYNVSSCNHLICPIMDARNNQVYTALYKWNTKEQERLTEYMGIRIEDLVKKIEDMLESGFQKVIFVGDGVWVHKTFLQKKLGEKCIFAPDGVLLQRASSLAEIALKSIGKNYSSKDTKYCSNTSFLDNIFSTNNVTNNVSSTDNKNSIDNTGSCVYSNIDLKSTNNIKDKNINDTVDNDTIDIDTADSDTVDDIKKVFVTMENSKENCFTLVPFYLRKSQAERMKDM